MAKSYEQLRAQVLQGYGPRSIAATVVQSQGVWAWMLLDSSATDSSARGPSVQALSTLSPPPAPVRSELLAVWTNLLLGTVTRQEA